MSDELAGCLYIIAAPSGGGKTSLVNELLRRFDHLKISISYTTRPMRPGEVNGENYHFVSDQTFKTMIDQQDFLEHAEVFGYQYGTSHHWVMKQLKKGHDIILEIDWQGARQIRQLFPMSVSIFIIPPSRETLYHRLQKRNQDDEATIERRMNEAIGEMTHCHEFDYLVVNDDFDVALQDLSHIIHAERLRGERQRVAQSELLSNLLAS